MGATAQLGGYRRAADSQNPDIISVFFIEYGNCPGFDCLPEWQCFSFYGQVGPDHFIDLVFYCLEFLMRNRFKVRKIETQPFRPHMGTPLFAVAAENCSQADMQQVCCSMVAGDIEPAVTGYFSLHPVSSLETAFNYTSFVQNTFRRSGHRGGNLKY